MMFDFQKILDSMAAVERVSRAKYHLTLQALIAALEGVPEDMPVEFSGGNSPGIMESYRGYYADLSIRPTSGVRYAGDLLRVARDSLGASFCGYKGGDFVMDSITPLWVADHGCCGDAIVSAAVQDGKLILATKNIDE
jgi:hypothetical protein